MGFTRTLRVISGVVLTGALVLTSAPNAAADQVRDDQWVLKSLDAESIWKTTRGKGEVVAVIDDGVNAQHRDLRGNVLDGKDFIDGGSAAPDKGDDHGTGMSGIIAAHGHGQGNRDGAVGLAPEAKILPIRDLGKRDDGYAAAIRYAVDRGASVINISQKQDNPLDKDAESKAITYALKRNVVIVAGPGTMVVGSDTRLHTQGSSERAACRRTAPSGKSPIGARGPCSVLLLWMLFQLAGQAI